MRTPRLGKYWFVLASVICVVAGVWLWVLRHPLEHCDKWEQVLSRGEHNPTVLLVEEGCSGFENGVTYAIDISPANAERATVFKYVDASWNAKYRNQTAPHVEWTGPHHLKISIGAVAAIDTKLDRIGQIDVSYDIGHVLSN